MRSDERLGVGAPITRRDFVNGTLAGAGAALLGAAAPAVAQGLDDAFTGYGGVGDYARSNGNTAAVVNAAHALRDGRYEALLGNVTPVDELYDVVVVGGGIAGLTAAYEIRKARPAARVLLLENHPVPGGEAKQNELVVDGVRLIGPQASNDTGVPRSGPFAEYWDALGLPQRFDFVEPTGAARDLRFARDNFDPWFWDEASANIGWFCDGTTFGTARGWHRDIFASDLRGVPLSARDKADLLAWRSIRTARRSSRSIPAFRSRGARWRRRRRVRVDGCSRRPTPSSNAGSARSCRCSSARRGSTRAATSQGWS